MFPVVYGVREREEFYKSVSFEGWGGSSGHDAVLIAYDALLGCAGNWNELCLRGILVCDSYAHKPLRAISSY